ncbi:cache domain-containing protein [Geomonas edaphica]|uniref:cache domain-containing protein n=1 Tax=Geomonas edaphica TaxID=2570226 RepID=UPI001FE3778F|nr:cache domain-containing protein [Geomonas edaphica]
MKHLKMATEKVPILLVITAVAIAFVMMVANRLVLEQIREEAVRQASRQQESSMAAFWEQTSRHGNLFHIEDGRMILGDYYVLNDSNEIPDRIFHITGSRATIFMGDTRIATNVMKADGTRAIGTRLIGPAYDTVFRQGMRYRGSVDILGIPYFTAYDPIRDPSGKVIGALFVGVKQSEYLARYNGIAVKITAINGTLAAIFVLFAVLLILNRRHSEKEIRTQLLFQQHLLDTIPSPIFSKDALGRYNLCNKAFQSYVGLTREELIGKSVFELWPEELAQRYYDMDREIMEATGTQIYESQVRYADGSLRDVMFHKASFRDEHGTPGGLVGVILDITERKAAEKERSLMEAQRHRSRMMELLLIQLNHDLNTPLTPLFALLPMIRRKVEDAGVDRMLEICQQCVNQIQGLAGKTFDLVRISSDRPRLLPVNLAVAADSALGDVSNALAERGVICCNAIDPELKVLGSAEQLTLLFKNLLGNAARYAAQNGKVVLSTTSREDEIVVSVRDDGVGLDREHLALIFDEFYKADSARHDLTTQGLGLAICKRIVINHDGMIWAESPGPGLGTTIFFTLKGDSSGDPLPVLYDI